nr:hypothetical protein [uncultured Roseovarius sp.]
MFGSVRVYWIVNKHLSAVLYSNGERETSLAGTILAKEVLDDGELDFQQEAHIYRRRSKKEAAFMVLVETASAWSVAGNELYAAYSLQAAHRLLNTYRSEANSEEWILDLFNRRVAERFEEQARRESIRSEHHD